MTFFARPNLDDVQFKQLSGTTLTLDGHTVINSVSGLSLTGDYGKIPIIATGETENHVLTYKSGKIVFAESSGSGGGIYSGASPTTCTVGGLNSDSDIYGCSITCVLEQILVPTITPTLTPNSLSFSILPATTVYEVGCQIKLSGSSTYSQGVVNPVFCGGPSVRTGLPTTYCYVDIGGGVCTVSSPSLNNVTEMALRTIYVGTNTMSASVAYSAGLPPKKSDGTEMTSSCCPAGTIPSPASQRSVCGVHPFFWGKSTTPITINQALIDTASGLGNKCVALSTNDIVVTNYNAGGVGQPLEYIWVAIPASSPNRVNYQGSNSATNFGTIPGDLFPSGVTLTINSPSSCWSGINYKFYVSNYPTSTVTETGLNYCITYIAG